MIYLAVYMLSTVGGMLIVGVLVRLMHRNLGAVGQPEDQIGKHRPLIRPLDVFVGFTERSIATTLFIWAPSTLPLFIGGWVAAKIAAGWGHRTGQEYAAAQSVALVGNAASFAVAIFAGYLLAPDSVLAFQTTQ